MSILNKYNKGNQFEFKTPRTHKYATLSELAKRFGLEKTHSVRALYTNDKSKFGVAPIAVTNDVIVNLPHHLLETVLEMMGDVEVAELANNNRLGIKLYQYEGANGTGYSVNWVELDEAIV